VRLRRRATSAALAFALSTLFARAFSQLAWPIDLIATLALHCAYALLALALVAVAAGCRSAAAICVVAAAGHGSWCLSEGAARAPAGAETVRIMSFNLRAGQSDHQKLLDLIASGPADIIVATESKERLNERLRTSPEIRDAYPYQVLHFNVVKLSRWPLTLIPSDIERWKDLEHSYNYRYTAIVEHPRTPFVLCALAPESPRSAEHWAIGNRYLERELEVIDRHFSGLGLPLVVAGDLNASPTGFRSRLVHQRLGLRRTKPPLLLSGSWPARAPRPLRVAIDAVLVGPGVRVAAWQTLEVETGSDHVPVIAEIAVPRSDATPRSPPAAAAD